ncbi:MAG: hypothetical protein PHI05_01900 [Bacilli bacterium]|nr:hypothetical protein [Bacilli bacterium]MDD4547482.1 hypothetical protein [Bacilli bacterium]
MINLYIDFDGVILDTITITSKLMEEQKIDLEDRPSVQKFFSELDWNYLLSTTPEINDSLSCIQKIIDTKLFNVAILTHINSLDEAVEKVNFIRKYFKDITVIPVPKVISKTKMVHTEGSILVDDYAGNLREWESEHGIAVRFSTKRNGKGFLVVDRLDQLIEMFSDTIK